MPLSPPSPRQRLHTRTVRYEGYLREDGLYHSSHRGRIDTVHRHLQQEVGRYENYKFYVRPQAVAGGIPRLDLCYTGAVPDRTVEARSARERG